MRNLLARLFARRPSAPARRPAPGFGLRLEALEVREVPASKLGFDHHRPEPQDTRHVATVVVDHDASDKVIKKVEKLHTLTVKNLAPGNYSVSHHVPRN